MIRLPVNIMAVLLRRKRRVLKFLLVICICAVVVWKLDIASPKGLSAAARVGDPKRLNTLKEVISSRVNGSSNIMILATTNTAYLDFAMNWLESVRRLNIRHNITIVAEDVKAYKYLRSRKELAGVNVVETGSGHTSSDVLAFGSKQYRTLVNKRQRYVLDLLEGGWNVLMCDVDAVWIQDPFQFVQGDFDIASQREKNTMRKKSEVIMLCAGFLFLRKTDRTISFVKAWIQYMDQNEEKPDQYYMNKLVWDNEIPNLKVNILNQDNFPSGKLYFNEEWRRNKTEIAVIHNNFLKGHELKVIRFRNHNLWLVNNSDLPSSQ